MPLTNYKVFGKPHAEAYHLTEALLRQQAAAQNPAKQSAGFGSIVAIGDNPESDIAGATLAGAGRICLLFTR